MLHLTQTRKARLDVGGQFGGQAVYGGVIHHQAFGGHALGIDDLMAVKDDAEKIDKAAFAQEHPLAIHQMLGLHQKLRGGQPCHPLALIQEHPVMLADNQIARVAQGACGDDPGRKGADSLKSGAPDPADRLAAMVARQHLVAGGQLLDRLLRAGGERDHGAAGKGNAQKVREARIIWGLFHPEKCVIGGRGHRREGQGKAAAIWQGQHQNLNTVALFAHQRVARLKPDDLPLAPDGRSGGDALCRAGRAGDDKTVRAVVWIKLINVTGTDIGGAHQPVALCRAMADIDVIGRQNLAGMTGECGKRFVCHHKARFKRTCVGSKGLAPQTQRGWATG